MTPYHAKYWAHSLALRGERGTVDSLSQSLGSARVDLNPHQVEAALFAVQSPLAQGVILADEVGLGKTIEAGLVLAQRWAERKRRILLILPATLRTQWQEELLSKFGIPSVIIERPRRPAAQPTNPFLTEGLVAICSYHFAAARAQQIAEIEWDLVILDEAHRLRNIYKGGRMAGTLERALRNRPKLLLTATPLQNSLMELYGLVCVADPRVFGDEASFRERFVRMDGGAPDLHAAEVERNRELRARLQTVCTRTLRRQVQEYVRFTERVAITQDFAPSPPEQDLYERVSAWLQKPVLLALPKGQRSLIVLVMRKLLASSTFAIAATLDKLLTRLERWAAQIDEEPADAEIDQEDCEDIGDLVEESDDEDPSPARPLLHVDRQALLAEIAELRDSLQLAQSIQQNAKGEALVRALSAALDRAAELGAQRKAVIFTESRRTQAYLYGLLSQNGYAGQIVLLNGSNSDPRGGAGDAGQGRGSMKARLVDEFRDRATLLIATETAAEGVNLQFCSLVVNYDLPWNPQRIEQRIGRCHRYGQQHDVVVLNFLNTANAADQRVYQLLSEKFHLFEGVFGASDEVLGSLESGVDVEHRIAQVYQECRTAEEIHAAFDRLQAELDESIRGRLENARRVLLENFDQEVQQRLRVFQDEARARLSQWQQWLWQLMRHELAGSAEFDPSTPRFCYRGGSTLAGWYNLDWREAERLEETFLALDHPLARSVIEASAGRSLPLAHLQIDCGSRGVHISAVERLQGQSGWLDFRRIEVRSFSAEQALILSGVTDGGHILDTETCHKLLEAPCACEPSKPGAQCPPPALEDAVQSAQQSEFDRIGQQCSAYFEQEVAKLDQWSDDLKLSLELSLRDLDRAIQEARRQARARVSLNEKLALQQQLRSLEQRRNQMRRELYERQDAIDAQRDQLIGGLESHLHAQPACEHLFRLRWSVA